MKRTREVKNGCDKVSHLDVNDDTNVIEFANGNLNSSRSLFINGLIDNHL